MDAGSRVAVVNLTACAGAVVLLVLPMDVVREAIPEPYQLHEYLPGSALVQFMAFSCQKVAVSGVDLGPHSYSYTLARLATVSGMPADDRASWWMLELVTSSPEMRTWLEGRRVPVSPGDADVSFEPLPYGVGRLEALVHVGAQDQYLVEASPYRQMSTWEESHRIFYDADPRIDWFSVDSVDQRSNGLGPGAISYTSGTALSQIVPSAGQAMRALAVSQGNQLMG